jgi:hypothetical protein
MQLPSKQGFAVIALGGDVALVPLAARQSKNNAADPASGGQNEYRSGTKAKREFGPQLVPRPSNRAEV